MATLLPKISVAPYIIFQLLSEEMIEAGYNPDTSWRTRDTQSVEEREAFMFSRRKSYYDMGKR